MAMISHKSREVYITTNRILVVSHKLFMSLAEYKLQIAPRKIRMENNCPDGSKFVNFIVDNLRTLQF